MGTGSICIPFERADGQLDGNMGHDRGRTCCDAYIAESAAPQDIFRAAGRSERSTDLALVQDQLRARRKVCVVLSAVGVEKGYFDPRVIHGSFAVPLCAGEVVEIRVHLTCA